MHGPEDRHDVGESDEQVGGDGNGLDGNRRKGEIEDGQRGQVDRGESAEDRGGETCPPGRSNEPGRLQRERAAMHQRVEHEENGGATDAA